MLEVKQSNYRSGIQLAKNDSGTGTINAVIFARNISDLAGFWFWPILIIFCCRSVTYIIVDHQSLICICFEFASHCGQYAKNSTTLSVHVHQIFITLLSRCKNYPKLNYLHEHQLSSELWLRCKKTLNFNSQALQTDKFWTGNPRNVPSKSVALSLSKHTWLFKNDASWDTLEHALPLSELYLVGLTHSANYLLFYLIRSVTRSYYRGAAGALLVYDISRWGAIGRV